MHWVASSSKTGKARQSSSTPPPLLDRLAAIPPQVASGYATCFVARPTSWQREQATDASLAPFHARATLRRTDPAAAATADGAANDTAMKAFFDDDKFLRVRTTDGATPKTVPYRQRLLVLADAHRGHLSGTRMYDRMATDYYWPEMRRSCELHTSTHCTSCIQAQQVHVRGNAGVSDTSLGKFEPLIRCS